jgi:hypothetical protein
MVVGKAYSRNSARFPPIGLKESPFGPGYLLPIAGLYRPLVPRVKSKDNLPIFFWNDFSLSLGSLSDWNLYNVTGKIEYLFIFAL